ncbi:MAG TPA: hypothetical protein VFR67_02355 [Pilimelia sp.]|nr:hypothetical protein [Pilimelia sp.]
MVEIVARWWNRRWGHLRRDIWLESDAQHWVVRGRVGGADGREVTYDFDRDYEAHAMVDRLKATAPGDWKDLTRLLQRDGKRPAATPET